MSCAKEINKIKNKTWFHDDQPRRRIKTPASLRHSVHSAAVGGRRAVVVAALCGTAAVARSSSGCCCGCAGAGDGQQPVAVFVGVVVRVVRVVCVV